MASFDGRANFSTTVVVTCVEKIGLATFFKHQSWKMLARPACFTVFVMSKATFSKV